MSFSLFCALSVSRQADSFPGGRALPPLGGERWRRSRRRGVSNFSNVYLTLIPTYNEVSYDDTQ